MLKKAFTLIEIILAMAIVGMLLAAALPNLGDFFNKAHNRNACTDLLTLQAAQQNFLERTDAYCVASSPACDSITELMANLRLNLRPENGHSYSCRSVGNSHVCEYKDGATVVADYNTCGIQFIPAPVPNTGTGTGTITNTGTSSGTATATSTMTLGGCDPNSNMGYCLGECVDITQVEHCGYGCNPCVTGQNCCSVEGLIKCVDVNISGNCAGCNEPACTGTTPACCDSECVDLAIDNPKHCGACGNNCEDTENYPIGTTCFEGECKNPPGKTDVCFNQWTDIKTDNGNCGNCGYLCWTTNVCIDGACTCGPGEEGCILYDPTCHNLYYDPKHCGECNNVCDPGFRCIPVDQGGGILKGTCELCPDSTPDACNNGKCVNFSNDPENCNGCGIYCPGLNPTCIESVCSTGTNTATGTSTATSTNTGLMPSCNYDSNCEGDAGESCFSCPEDCGGCSCEDRGNIVCESECVDPRINPSNCGDCGITCPSGVCQNRICEPCPKQTCGGSCVDTSSDPAHCSGCNSPCPQNGVCSNGSCVCPAPTTQECQENGVNYCADLSADPDNCGVCGNICLHGQTCVFGECGCGIGTILCGEACEDENFHCGGCGGPACNTAAGEQCCNGGCQESTYFEDNHDHCGACYNNCGSGECVGTACEGGTGTDTGTSTATGTSSNTNTGVCDPSIQQFCNGECVELNDPSHCGACNNACSILEICKFNAGSFSCKPSSLTCSDDSECSGSYSCCDSMCVDTQAHPDYCGDCYTSCPSGVCSGGMCTVGTGTNTGTGTATGTGTGMLTLCGVIPTDLQNDYQNCGACGKVCIEATSCLNGSCQCDEGSGNDCFGECPIGNECPDGSICCQGVCIGGYTYVVGDGSNGGYSQCGFCNSTCPYGFTCNDGYCFWV